MAQASPLTVASIKAMGLTVEQVRQARDLEARGIDPAYEYNWVTEAYEVSSGFLLRVRSAA